MPKEFYTERDIEDLYRRGVRSLKITENVVLTELAYEKAKRLDFQLITERADNPPAAPVRPYLSEPPVRQTNPPAPTVAPVAPSASIPAKPTPTPSSREAVQPNLQREAGNDIEKRIHDAVIARLGNQVDATLLNSIIHRVVKGVGLK